MGVGAHALAAGVGYVLAILLQALAHTARVKTSRFNVALRTAAGLVATVTTLSWLVPAAMSGGVVGGIFVFLLLFVFLPFVLAFLGLRLRRLRPHGPPVWHTLLAGGFGLLLLLTGTVLLADGVLHLAGVSPRVSLTVDGLTATTSGRHHTPGFAVSGTYVLDGEQRYTDDALWFGASPAAGDVVEVSVSPLWPTLVIEHAVVAWVLVAVGGGCAALGGGFLRLGIRDHRRETGPGKTRAPSVERS